MAIDTIDTIDAIDAIDAIDTIDTIVAIAGIGCNSVGDGERYLAKARGFSSWQ